MAKQNVNFEINDERAFTLVAFDQVGNAITSMSMSKIFNERPIEVKDMYLKKILERFEMDLSSKLLK